MRHVRSYIRERQARFAGIPFFDQLNQNESPQNALAFIRGLTFWVQVFQDILRLNEARVQSPALRRIARHHRAEDKGHNEWFLQDLTTLEGSIPDARELFSTNTATRDASYQLVSEVFRTDDDRTRIAHLLTLESTGHAFFTCVIRNAERVGVSSKLLYFARKHLDVELGHELFEEEMNSVIDSMELNATERVEVIAAVDRSFDAITSMIEALAERVNFEGPVSLRPGYMTLPPASGIVQRVPPLRQQQFKLASNEDG